MEKERTLGKLNNINLRLGLEVFELDSVDLGNEILKLRSRHFEKLWGFYRFLNREHILFRFF